MYKEILCNSDEITQFVIENSTTFLDEELISEYFDGSQAFLKTVDICSLKMEDTNHHLISKRKEIAYERLPIETMPPLIVENNTVIDGNHRLRIAIKKGMSKINIYDVIAL